MRSISKWRVFVSLACASISASAQSAMQAPSAHPPMGAEALGAIVGEWQSDVVEGRSARSSCIWTPQHTAVLCEQTIIAPDGEHHALDLYTFDPRSGKYFFYLVQQPGNFAQPVPLRIDGAIWTYGGTNAATDGRRFRTINDFSGKDTYSWRLETSTDGEHWTTTRGGHSERVPHAS